MEVVKKIAVIRERLKTERARNTKIGFVPTMGFLHEGHLSLVREAKKTCDFVVMSIFVNPLQFAPNEDLNRYPRDPEGDLKKAKITGADLVFFPAASEIYPEEQATFVEVTGLTEGLCGAFRPGHFRGVATVVAKLLNIVAPDQVFFGQKDAQQALVICKMVTDLNMNIIVTVCPTIREPDGLAMSSRNNYLNPAQREAATILYQSLQAAVQLITEGERDPEAVAAEMKNIIAREPLARLEYAVAVDGETLKTQEKLKNKVLLALAVWIDRVRLIDNMMVEVL